MGGHGLVMLWTMFSWDTLGLIIPIAYFLTAVRSLNIVLNQEPPFIATVFLDATVMAVSYRIALPESSRRGLRNMMVKVI